MARIARKRRCGRSQKGLSEISQFIPVLWVTVFLCLMPLLDLSFLFVAAATQYLVTNDFAAKAAAQNGYNSALNMMTAEAFKFQNSGLAKFIKMVPDGGYVGCGDDMYVVSTVIADGNVSSSPANAPLGQTVNTTSRMYELTVKSKYSVTPMVNFSSVPVLGSVPGLGAPVTFAFSANRPIERPGAFQGADNSGDPAGALPAFPRIPTGLVTNNNNIGQTWRSPTIYDQIRAAGQNVVSDNVFEVPATREAWTASGVSLQAGQKIWIDTQAVGTWNIGGTAGAYPNCDANGLAGMTQSTDIAYPLQRAALVGKVGSNQPFIVGDTLLNYSLSGVGPISMVFNDAPGNFADNTGDQVVRIIITE